MLRYLFNPTARTLKPKPFQFYQLKWNTTITNLYRPLAFYSIVPLSESRVNQLKIAIERDLTKLGVIGRIYLAPCTGIGGINSQLSVPMNQIDQVKSYFGQHFADIEFTQGIQDTTAPNFSKLRVLIKKNLVSIRENVTTKDLSLQQPHHLTPGDWHSELAQKKDNVFLLDMRNKYEYDVGHFDHAIKMDVDTFRDGIKLLDTLTANRSKKEDIYMYCTGGIRCSVAGSYLKKKGYENVKMLKGGVTAYGHYVRREPVLSLFKGKNFTFDGRRGEPITNDVLTQCYHCGSSCDHITNCSNTKCHLLFVQCPQCQSKMHHTCSDHCQKVLEGKEEYHLEYDYHRQISEAW